MKQKGFTLIELVAVIVLIGILAAVAIPKFVDLTSQANTAAIKGVEGGVRSASGLVHALALASGQTGATGTVTVEGTSVSTVYGYPALADINKAANVQGGTVTFANGVYTIKTNCTLTYAVATASTDPVITLVTTGC